MGELTTDLGELYQYTPYYRNWELNYTGNFGFSFALVFHSQPISNLYTTPQAESLDQI